MVIMNPVELSLEQREALETLVHGKQQVQTLGGYAGTGKTTVIRQLIERLPEYAVCAYTGKAAHVLRRKGVPASTIHSLIYEAVPDEHGGEPTFNLREELPYQGVIVDEASMVGKLIYHDLLSFGLPLIFVGDHGQLPPVSDDKDPFNLMEKPQLVLETVHRNAGEIARFAEFVRKGNRPGDWDRIGLHPPTDHPRGFNIQFHRTIDDALCDLPTALEYGQIIVAKNSTRVQLNRIMRAELGRLDDLPQGGDRVMCLRNNRHLGLFNGMQGRLTGVERNLLHFTNDEGREFKVYCQLTAFNAERKPDYDRTQIPFDYSWAVTCHKAQGDEWDRVLVVEEKCGRAWDHTKWCYTAASRAKTRLDWVEA